MPTTYTATTPKGTPVLITRPTPYTFSASLATLDGKMIEGKMSAGTPRPNTANWIAIGRDRLALDYDEMLMLREWMDQRPELTEAEETRGSVRALDNAAEDAEHASYYDPARICKARNAANKALAEWRESYPTEAAEEDRQGRKDQAANLRRQALQALDFSCDGSYGPAARQARHDEMMAEASALEAA